jgi:hypothetical protein
MSFNINFSNCIASPKVGIANSTYPQERNININHRLNSGRSFEEMLHAREPAHDCGCGPRLQEPVSDPYRQPISKPAYYGRPSDEAGAMADMTSTLEKLADNLRGQLDLEAFDGFESATDGMQSAAQRLSKNFTDRIAAHDFETAVDKLNHAVGGLTGKVDGELYDMLKEAVRDLDIATDKLKHVLKKGNEGARAENSFQNVTAKLDHVIDMAENLGHGNGNGIESPPWGPIDVSPYPAPARPGGGPIYGTYPDIVQPTSNWTVDKEARTIELDNGYKLSFENKHNAWRLSDAEDNTMRVWGDPHVDENADGTTDWNFKHDSTFILEDGTKITVGTKDVGNRLTVTDDLTITKGNQGILVTGIGDNDLRISDVMDNGRELDEVTNDGYVFRQGEGVNDWYSRVKITGDQAMDGRRDYEESV